MRLDCGRPIEVLGSLNHRLRRCRSPSGDASIQSLDVDVVAAGGLTFYLGNFAVPGAQGRNRGAQHI